MKHQNHRGYSRSGEQVEVAECDHGYKATLSAPPRYCANPQGELLFIVGRKNRASAGQPENDLDVIVDGQRCDSPVAIKKVLLASSVRSELVEEHYVGLVDNFLAGAKKNRDRLASRRTSSARKRPPQSERLWNQQDGPMPSHQRNVR